MIKLQYILNLNNAETEYPLVTNRTRTYNIYYNELPLEHYQRLIRECLAFSVIATNIRFYNFNSEFITSTIYLKYRYLNNEYCFTCTEKQLQDIDCGRDDIVRTTFIILLLPVKNENYQLCLVHNCELQNLDVSIVAINNTNEFVLTGLSISDNKLFVHEPMRKIASNLYLLSTTYKSKDYSEMLEFTTDEQIITEGFYRLKKIICSFIALNKLI